MTSDVIALLKAAPSSEDVVTALTAAAPQLRFGSVRDGAVLEVVDDDFATVLTIESARRIAVPGEAVRLLDVDEEPDTPYWWVEFRCPVHRSDGRVIASTIASTLLEQHGGVLWSAATVPDVS